MPVIEKFTAKQGLDIGSAPSPKVDTSAARAAAQQGAALAGLGQDVSGVAQQFMRREEQTEDFSARIGLQQTVQSIQTEDQEASQNMPANGEGWHQQRSQAAKAKLDTFIGTLPQRLQTEFRQRADLTLGGLNRGYANDQLKQRTAWSVDNINTTAKGAGEAVFSNPEALEDQRRGMHDLIKVAPIGELEKQKAYRVVDEALAEAKVRGLIERDPEAGAKAVGAKRDNGQVGGIDVYEKPPGGGATGNGPPGSGGRARALGMLERAAGIKTYYQDKHGLSDVAAAALGGHAIQESSARSTGPDGDNGTSSGVFQWRNERRASLQRFASDRGQNWRDLSTQLDFAKYEGENGDAGAKRAWRELQSATTVEQAVTAWMHFERPAGYSPDNPRGGHGYAARLANAKRLLGQSGDTSAMETGGSSGTGRYVLGDAPDDVKGLSFEKRLALLRQAESAMREVSVQKRAGIESVVENAPAAIQQTGEYNGALPSRQDFIDAYGADGNDKANAFEVAVETAKTIRGMQTMPTAEIEATVAGATPVSSGNDAALEGKRYDVIQRAAAATVKAREADPAAYVMQAMPAVRSAWDGVEPGSAGYANAVRATVEAQRFLGIPADKIAPLPDAIAKGAAKAVKDDTKTADARLASVVSTVFSTNDPDQQQAIFRQMVKEGAPQELAGVMSAIARGDRGSAEWLFAAAVSDPSKLPGKVETKDAQINEQIQSRLLADGKIGDAIYGLSTGGADAYAIATRDAPLIKKSVQMYLRNGMSLGDAVDATARNMWGDVSVYKGGYGVAAEAVVPRGTDAFTLSKGLQKASADVFRPAIEAQARAEVERIDPKDAGTRSVADLVLKRAVDAKLDASTFRTYAPGRLGLVDDMTGRYIAGADGKPITVSIDDLLASGKMSGETRAVGPRGAGAIATPRAGVQ